MRDFCYKIPLLFIGIYFGFSMGISTPLGYAYGNKRVDICRILERYAYRFLGCSNCNLHINL